MSTDIISQAVEAHFNRVNTNSSEASSEAQEATQNTQEEDTAPAPIKPTEMADIPPSEVLSVDQVARDKDADWKGYMHRYSIDMYGAGGIGSWASFLMARLKPFSLTILDPDNVDLTNIGGQLYSHKDVGYSKTNSIGNFIYNYCQFNPYTHKVTVTSSTTSVADFVVCGFDNMKARKDVFESWNREKQYAQNQVLIDARLSAEVFQIFILQREDEEAIENYKKNYLFDDSAAVQEACSYKQTSFCAAMIGSFIANIIVNIIANKHGANRSVPSLLTYDAYTMTLDYGSI